MLKKIAFAVAVVLVPVFVFAGGMIEKGTQTYNDIESLIDAGVITKPLVKQSLTGAEVADYISDGIDNVLYAAAAKPAAAAKETSAAQIEKLYNLVKQYIGDMQKADKKLNDILEVMGDLKVKKAELEKKQDRLLNLMGMRINGESSAYMTQLSLDYVDESINDKTYRPITQYIDLKFSLNANKDLYAEATFRLENLFGGYWGSYDIYGLKRYFVQGSYPISFVMGDYQGKMTPLTMWAVDDERPFEAKLFSDRREINKNELYLINNSWPLNGAKIHTVIELFDVLDVNFQVLGARLSEFANGASKLFQHYQYSAGAEEFAATNYNHDQYMLGGRLSTDATLGDMFTIGINFNEISDSKDTGTYSAPVIDNYVGSFDAEFKMELFEGAQIKAKGEYAMSWYTGNKHVIPYVTDAAINAGIEAKAFDTELCVDFRSVGKDFTAFAAQTRINPFNINASADNNSQYYVSQNNSWNIALTPPQYKIGPDVYPFTQYNPRITVNYNGTAGERGGLLPGYFFENAATYAGAATPDRMGVSALVKGSYLDSMIKPAVKVEFFTEYFGEQRDFMVIEGGLSASIIGINVHGGYKMETATRLSGEEFATSIIDAGIEYGLLPKKLSVHSGLKVVTFAGLEDRIGDGVTGDIDFNGNLLTWGIGLDYMIAKPAKVSVAFTSTKVNVKEDAVQAADYLANELDVRVSINF